MVRVKKDNVTKSVEEAIVSDYISAGWSIVKEDKKATNNKPKEMSNEQKV